MNKFPVITEFASQEVPVFLEKKNKNLVWFGKDNLYPFELIDLYNDSSTHNAIINGKVGYIVGNGLEAVDLKTKKWLSHANIDQDWTSLMKSLALDYELFNGYAIEVIKTKVGNQYHHLDFANIRIGLDGSIQYADNWITDKGLKNSKPDIQYLERYNPRDPEQKRGVIYHVDYRPNLKYYPLPVYVGSLAEIRTDVQIGDYWLNEVENGFVGGTLIQHNNGVPETKEESESFEKAFQEKFGKATGTKIVHLFSPSKENSSEITNLNGNDLHERYINMSKRVKESIFIGHRVTNPILFGVKEEGQLGARNELDLAYEIFMNTYVAERQNTLLRTVRKLAYLDVQQTDIEIKPLKPIDTVDLTSDIILNNLTQEEIRGLIEQQTGLELEQPTQTQMNVEDDSEMIDGIVELLLKVDDLENRKQMALDDLKDFEEKGVVYDKGDFLNRVGLADKFETYNDYPKAASENAKRALRWAEENGWGSCGTAVGKRRANQLANGENISRETIARMAAFERHRQNSNKKLGDGCGRLMWLAWGGDEGIAWAQRKLEQIDNEKMTACSHFSDDQDISHLFDNIGEPESNFEVIDSFDIKFGKDGTPIEFATEEQTIIQRVLKFILDNPLIAATGIAEALNLDFDNLVGAITILSESDLIAIEGSSIELTNVGERVAKAIEVPKTEVRYRYELRPDAPALKQGGTSRPFCQKMMANRKLYSKKEIDLIRNDMKSSNIADVTDVWLARGGWYRKLNTTTSVPYCRHIWKQVIVRKR